MARFGWYLIIFGAGSVLLSVFDREFVILSWVNTWGEGVAWLIRGGLVIAGLIMLSVPDPFVDGLADEFEDEEADVPDVA